MSNRKGPNTKQEMTKEEIIKENYKSFSSETLMNYMDSDQSGKFETYLKNALNTLGNNDFLKLFNEKFTDCKKHQSEKTIVKKIVVKLMDMKHGSIAVSQIARKVLLSVLAGNEATNNCVKCNIPIVKPTVVKDDKVQPKVSKVDTKK